MSESSTNGINLEQKPLVQHLLLQQPPQFNEEEEEIDIKGITGIIRRRGWWMLTVGILVSGLVGWQLFKRPPVYQESFQLLIVPPNADSLSNPLLGQIVNLSGGRSDDAYYATQLDLLVSNRLLQPVIEALQQQKSFFKDEAQRQNFTIDNFLRQLKVSKGKDTQIVEISYQADSPEEVKFVLTRLASAYLKYTIQEKTRQSKQKLFFIDEQIPVIKQRILLLQKRLEQFRLKNDFIDPTNQGGVIAEGLKQLNTANKRITRN